MRWLALAISWELASCLVGCTSRLPGYPRYVATTPGAPASRLPKRAPEAVSLHPAGGTWEFKSEGGGVHANFRIAIRDAEVGDPPSPRGVAPFADVRTRDLRLAEQTYRRLYCARAWTRTAAEEGACSLFGPEKEGPAGAVVVQRLLGLLRAEAAALGAVAVVDVRCYAWSDRRAWCEGTAAR